MNKFIKNHFSALKNAGFTLIELLVVVLVIGVLAAVALPQYQKSVLKTRMVEAQQLVSQLLVAEEQFFLANGTYTACFNDLDIDFTGFDDLIDKDGCIWKMTRGTRAKGNQLEFYISGSPESALTIYAWYGNYFNTRGYGGFGAQVSNRRTFNRPLSCVEYTCNGIERGLFCPKVMNWNTPSWTSACAQFFSKE